MRQIVLAVVLASGFGMYSYAQTQRTNETKFFRATVTKPGSQVSMVQADSRRPQPDGSIRVSGGVVMVVNGVRITTDSAVINPTTNVVEITGGNTRIELPTARN